MFSAKEKAQVARRELERRQRTYPKRVEAGYMDQVVAIRELAVMSEIVRDYEAVAAVGIVRDRRTA
jgi:hypothetical protein